MTVKNIGSSGVEFPDSTVQGSAAYTKAESDTRNPIANIVFNGQLAGPTAPVIGYGIATITRSSTGSFDLVFSTPQINASYIIQATSFNTHTGIIATVASGTVNGFTLVFYDAAGALANPGQVNVTVWKV